MGALMGEDMKQVGARIRELREIFDITEDDMAREVGVDSKLYREYEAEGNNIPISVLYHISQKFKVDMTEILTGKPARLDTYAICRRGQGKEIDRYEGYRFESLAHRFLGRSMEPLLVTLLPSDHKAALVTHRGQEFNLILEGTIVVTYDNKEHLLSEGDSIYFDPTHPHGQHAVGEQKARFLTVIME
jgi:mannose-6-phosphate isomerase-like protein (cupin superfamily)